MRAFAGGWLILLLAPCMAIAEPRLPPVDEASRNPAFLEFRADLRAAIARRDVDFVLAVVDSSIKNGFGGDDGIAAFERQWQPRSPSSLLWRELGSTLSLGGSFDPDGRFIAPYVFSRWPESIDAFRHLAVTSSGVRVRAQPSLDGAIVGKLSHAIVPRATRQSLPENSAWTAIRRANGRTGYVANQFLRSPIGYRAFFVPVNGRWKLVMFLAGD